MQVPVWYIYGSTPPGNFRFTIFLFISFRLEQPSGVSILKDLACVDYINNALEPANYITVMLYYNLQRKTARLITCKMELIMKFLDIVGPSLFFSANPLALHIRQSLKKNSIQAVTSTQNII